MSLWAFVCSVHLCYSVRNRTHPRYEMSHKQIAGEFFLSRWVVFSLTEHTEFTELFGALFRSHRGPSAYREHRAFQLSLGVMYVREESSCDDKKSLQPTILTTLTTPI